MEEGTTKKTSLKSYNTEKDMEIQRSMNRSS